MYGIANINIIHEANTEIRDCNTCTDIDTFTIFKVKYIFQILR